MLKSITYYLDGRLFEWSFAAATLGLAVEIFMWPGMMSRSAFRWIITDYVKDENLALFILVLGIIRVAALAANGASFVIGPILRSVCAIISAVIWGQFASSLIVYAQPVPSPAIPFWIVSTLAEIYVAYRAMLDLRRVYHEGSL